jgi:hypothetical protein
MKQTDVSAIRHVVYIVFTNETWWPNHSYKTIPPPPHLVYRDAITKI